MHSLHLMAFRKLRVFRFSVRWTSGQLNRRFGQIVDVFSAFTYTFVRFLVSANAGIDLPLSISEHKVEGKDDPYHQTEAGIQDYGGQESHKPNSLQT